MRPETAILVDLAGRVLGDDPVDWPSLGSHATLREAIAAVVPGYAAIGRIATDGEFQVAGRTFHDPVFATDDGRARFHVVDVPQAPDGFQLMTIRSEGQFNTVVYEEEDLYRGNTGRDVVMMSAHDATRLGIAEGDRVEVASAAGRLRVRAAIVDIAKGALAMYFPEANALVDARLDPDSKTPAFKSVPVQLRRL